MKLAEITKKHRKAASRHVVVFELDADSKVKKRLFSFSSQIKEYKNKEIAAIRKRLEQLFRTKKYKGLLEQYRMVARKRNQYSKESEQYKSYQSELDRIGTQMKKMQKEYRITFEDIRHDMMKRTKNSDINSIFILSAAEDIWHGVETVLYRNGQTLHFGRNLPEIRAKQINRGITAKFDAEGNLYFKLDQMVLKLKIKAKDQFLKDELIEITHFLLNPLENEKQAVEQFMETGIPQNTFRPCYCSVVVKKIRGRLRIYLHITVEGNPCQKKDRAGKPRHDFSKTGNVGVDIGTQTVAAYSVNGILLENLAERNGVSTRRSEAKERRLKRKMDRSRRAMNPYNYNANGTVKPKSQRKPWIESKTYQKDKAAYQELSRKNADSRKFANRELANRVRSMGDVFITEPKNAAKLAKKAKPSDLVIKEDGKIKYKKRTRFGKSIQNRCPGQFQADCNRKFQTGYHEVPYSYRASQYDHTAKDYIKKELNDRMYPLADGTIVQRDLYSAFLLSSTNSDRTAPDQETLESGFPKFKEKMETLIQQIQKNKKKICNSGIKIL